MKPLLLCLIAAAVLLPIEARGQSVLFDDGVNSANCLPFECTSFFQTDHYQQVYSASKFDGPVLINSMTFFSDDEYGSSYVSTSSFVLALSTTPRSVNGLNADDLATNVGPDQQVVFSGQLQRNSSEYTITFSDPFYYGPASGNLLLDVVVSTFGSDSDGFMDSRMDTEMTSRAGTYYGGVFYDPSGLVTRFDYTRVSAVPEPISLVLLGTGLVGVAAARRRKRR